MQITPVLRRITEADLDFLAGVYFSTREQEMALTGWPQQQINNFLQMQFDAQHQHYMTHYNTERFYVIEHQKQAVGRLYVHSMPREIRIVDIALLPAWRGMGLGSFLINQILREASTEKKAVSIHVEKNNPALAWYERMGFTKAEDKGVYDFMVTYPSPYEVNNEPH